MSTIRKIYQSFRNGPIFVVLFGLIFFGIGTALTYRQFAIREGAVEVPGVVRGHILGSCDDDGCSYHSMMDYQTLEGESRSYTTKFSSSPPAYDVGEQVTMFYQPDNPNEVTIKGEGGIFRIVFMSVGSAIMLGGLVFFGINFRNSLLAEE
jgi:hypothetical protein